MSKSEKLTIEGNEIALRQINDQDYISLTDMSNWDGDPNARSRVQSWLKNGGTLQFLQLWEQHHNPNFNYSRSNVIST